MLRIALPKGRLGDKVYGLFKSIGYECPDLEAGGRKLIFTDEKQRFCFMTVKPSDVPVFVERGAADIGVAGRDTILETNADIYELLDLKTGLCKMAVCGKPNALENKDRPLIVATKFPRIAEKYFQKLSRQIDIVKLQGSVELAAVVSLSDVIVDLVETGKTLEENGLVVLDAFLEISARLIANKSRYQFLSEEIGAIVESLSGVKV